MQSTETLSALYAPLQIRKLILPNRAVVPPMCLRVAEAGTGLANSEHLVHYAALAEAGNGLVILEATAVEPRAYIAPTDLGLWEDAQIPGLRRITDYFHKYTPAKIAIQLSHAGRKGLLKNFTSANPEQLAVDDKLGGELYAPSPLRFSSQFRIPREMTLEDIERVKDAHVCAARRAVEAGFDAIEIQCAHGFLLHTFYSPIANQRTDAYGGSFENRIRLPLEVATLVRAAIPESMPLIYRLSCSEWIEGGWTVEDSIKLSKELKDRGVDVINCSSGGIAQEQDITVSFQYQVPFADQIKHAANVPTIAVGAISSVEEAARIIADNRADLVAAGRAQLKNAFWLRNQTKACGAVPWFPPRQMMGFMQSKRRQAKQQANSILEAESTVETAA
eukprot:Gregarina_sp_Pseudo_9__3864@NODE_400_length_2922_cov_313_993410_g377_i0_p2_GENE_NODE_400_length_2922_cov_313_993410_g377_i0NODE_400_length_2922_cov_313_993410_g377_i0_p2_ORF_typecomplete_len391_score61_73Oxidored_FMN/PF00724_20/9_8e98Dus/PF01207_17/5e05_NODE_400_length_2922_cov_313_993410_g377_i01651337